MKRTARLFLRVPLSTLFGVAAAMVPFVASPTTALAQDNPDMRVTRIAVSPDTVRVRVGERASV